MNRHHRAHRVLAVTALVLGLASACAVPTNEEPVELSGSVPFGLLDTTTTTSTPQEGATKDAVVYLLDTSDGTTRLQFIDRQVDLDAGIQDVLVTLFALRPSDEQLGQTGLINAIPESATLLSATRSETKPGRLVVDVRGLFESIQGVNLRDALAQIVFTATVPGTGIVEVVFRNDGEAVQALVDDLESTENAVRRENYQSLQ